MATSSAKESPELEGKVEGDSLPTPQSHDVESKTTKEPATGFSIIHQERSLSHREWKDGKKREREQRRRDREKRKEYHEYRIRIKKEAIEMNQRSIRTWENAKTDIQRQLNAARTEQERSQLESEMKEKERLIQHWKQRKEHYQGKVKSHEESLKHVEKEEEEEKESLENEKFLEDAMRQGFINISEVKCLLVGPAGVGKTCLKYLLLSKPPPGTRSSTACRDRPVRVIRVGKLGEEWKEIDANMLAELIAQSIPALRLGSLASLPSHLLRKVQQNPESKVAAGGQAALVHTPQSSENESSDDESESLLTSESSASEEESVPTDPTSRVWQKLLQHLTQHNEDKQEGIEDLFSAEWMYFIDSGGQPAFHDLIPLFAPNTTAAIYVHRLCEALDDYPAADYYKEGEQVGPNEKAPATNMDTLKCMAQTIHTQLHEGKLPAFMTVGTYRDLEHKCTKETREEKNKRLYEFLHPLFPDLVLNGNTLNPIFALDTAKPSDIDFKTANALREAIQKSAVKGKAIPIWWYVLELILSLLSSQLGRKVLSYDECLAEATKLNFTEDAFKAALSYLHELNLVLYYPKGLPKVVFSDAQVPVAILTFLVETFYQLRGAKEGKETTENVCTRNEDWIKFRDQGIVTIKFLSSEEFKEYFHEGLFSPIDFLHLLQGVLAATPLSEDEFFVPAFLARLTQPELTGYLNSQPISTSFAVCFSNDCAPAAVFCCSIVHLQLHSGWEIIQDPSKPLARNCMQFELPYSISIVTIIDNYRFFRVCVDVPEEEKLGEVCQSIRKEIFEAIKAAAKNLQYSNSVPHVGFQCLQDDEYHKTTPHTVDIKKCFWKCPNNPRVRGKLSDSQHIWLRQENDDSTGTVKKSQEPELKDLMEHVGSVIPAKWQEVGIQLGLEDNELEEIKSDVSGSKSCFQKVFALWKRTKRSEYKWNTVCEALRSKHVNEVNLAKTIRSKFVD